MKNPLPWIWTAFVLWQVIFLVASLYVPAAPRGQPWLPPLLGVPAMVLVGIAGEGRLLRRIGSDKSWYILRWTLLEAGPLLGLASWYVSDERVVQAGCALAAFSALGLAYPRSTALIHEE